MHRGEWVGVDLDGTLAYYDHWRGSDHIGKPIPLMVRRVKNLLERGYTVKIFTARAYQARQEEIDLIKAWCLKHIGQELEVTCIKDKGMIQLFDDRAVQIVPNTGKIVYQSKDKIK
jgi:hypothetical protein